MKTIIHIGAHKTATTFIQNTLELNRALLREQRVRYIGVNKMRRSITPLLRTGSQSVDIIRENIFSDSSKRFNQLLISDENIIGWSEDIYQSGTPYPRAQIQLSTLHKALKGHEIKIILVIRNYNDFFSSMYCEALRHRKNYISFREYINKLDYLSWSWFELINIIKDIFGEQNIEILQFEEIIKNFDIFFSNIISKNFESIVLQKENNNSRSSFRQKTIEILDHLSKIEQPRLVNKLKRRMDNFYKTQGFDEKFTPWTNLEKTLLEERYFKEFRDL